MQKLQNFYILLSSLFIFLIRKDVETLNAKVKERKIPFYYSPLFGSDYPWKYQMDAQWASLLSKVPTINLKIYLKINNFTFPLNYGIERKDVANFYGNEYIYSGFEGKINSYYLNEKNNQLNFVVVCSDKYYYLKKTKLVIEKK